MLEKRQHPRVKIQELHAEICVSAADPFQRCILQGSVLDMSNTGIKIKLLTAMPKIPAHSNISIVLTNVNLSTPLKIKGMLRHVSADNECGIAFSSQTSTLEVDEFVFECVRNNAFSAPPQCGHGT